MSVTIRLSKIGKKHAPSYKIVVTKTRNKRDGKTLDVLGSFNPSSKPVYYSMDEKKFKEWRAKGALVSDAVEKLSSGSYEFIPYKGSKKPGRADQPIAEVKEQSVESEEKIETEVVEPVEEKIVENEKEDK